VGTCAECPHLKVGLWRASRQNHTTKLEIILQSRFPAIQNTSQVSTKARCDPVLNFPSRSLRVTSSKRSQQQLQDARRLPSVCKHGQQIFVGTFDNHNQTAANAMVRFLHLAISFLFGPSSRIMVLAREVRQEYIEHVLHAIWVTGVSILDGTLLHKLRGVQICPRIHHVVACSALHQQSSVPAPCNSCNLFESLVQMARGYGLGI
jgi:hypothetical protein